MNRLAYVLKSDVSCERAREQSGFAEDLEAVADPYNKTAFAGEGTDRLHHAREFRDGTGAQIVSIGETSRYDNCVTTL